MHELLATLPASAVVLDLGCSKGSFEASAYPCFVLRVDLNSSTSPQPPNVLRVQADAAMLPVRDHAVDFVVCNHSLEHMEQLQHSLREIGRVLKPAAPLFVSVPDATTFTDRVYRWLAKGGGHVNPFTDAKELAARISAATNREHCRTLTLFTSLSFLNRNNIPGRVQHKVRLFFGGGNEMFLALLLRTLHACDSVLNTRLAIYGWAMYFGNCAPSGSNVQELSTRKNVCVRCGSAHDRTALSPEVARLAKVFPYWRCPQCGASNMLVS